MLKQLELNLFLDSFLENAIQKEMGYLKMSECVENLYLKPVLQKKHIESCKHTADLKKCFLDSNIAPTKKPYGTGLKFEKWMHPKSLLKITDKKRMLNEIILAEEKCIADYNLLLINKDLPSNLRTIINNQKKIVEKSLIELKNYSLLEGILL